MMLIYPVISMAAPIVHIGSRAALLGEHPDNQLIAAFSAELWVNEQTPPTFLVHTTDDPVDAQNSIAFYIALKAKGVPVEMHLFAQGGHGYGMADNLSLPVAAWTKLCEKWLQTNYWLP
ncbi:MAG: prolyl oligopeptidase family serine peptidase [Cytophagales bacterium]|nr:prolyl oligopeptidase family serine peptidase [Cytophagales bacterium]